ncbi:MAG: hypothetical protein ACYTKD_14965 [Planctomycetota bacterium]|jgi:hypothetical protein
MFRLNGLTTAMILLLFCSGCIWPWCRRDWAGNPRASAVTLALTPTEVRVRRGGSIELTLTARHRDEWPGKALSEELHGEAVSWGREKLWIAVVPPHGNYPDGDHDLWTVDGRNWRNATTGDPPPDRQVLNWNGGIRDRADDYPRKTLDEAIQAVELAGRPPRGTVDRQWFLLSPMKVVVMSEALAEPGAYRIVAEVRGGLKFPYVWHSNQVIVTVE